MKRFLQNAIRPLSAIAASLVLFAPPGVAQTGPLKMPTVPVAVPGEIVFKAPAKIADADLKTVIDGAGCQISYPIPYAPGCYVLTLKGRARPTRALAVPAPPSVDVNAAIAKLTATPGAIANPNWIKYLTQTTTTGPAVAPLYPNDPLYGSKQQWHMNLINMPQAWGIQIGVKSIIAADVDTGIDVGHPDFATPDGKGTRILPGVNVAAAPTVTTDVTDKLGHGITRRERSALPPTTVWALPVSRA